MGWNFDQWAIAAARLGRPREVSFDEAYRLKRRWQQLHTSKPGDVPLVGMRAPRDDHFAAELFAQGSSLLERQSNQHADRKRA